MGSGGQAYSYPIPAPPYGRSPHLLCIHHPRRILLLPLPSPGQPPCLPVRFKAPSFLLRAFPSLLGGLDALRMPLSLSPLSAGLLHTTCLLP